MKKAILFIIIFLFSLKLVYSANELISECISKSSTDKDNLNLVDGPEVVLQKYIKENNEEEVLMFFYDENEEEIGNLKLILNYKKLSNNLYSFFAKNEEECNENEPGCKEYFVKKIIPDKCRRFGLELRLEPSKEIIKEEIKDLSVFDNCNNLKEYNSFCSDSIIIRGMNRAFYFFKYLAHKLNPSLEPIPFSPDLSLCKRINIVITGQGFNSYEEKNNFRKLADEAILNGVFRNDLLVSNAFRFNFYLLDPENDFSCVNNYLNIERALYCDYSKIINSISKCPNDFVLVLVNSNEDAGSTSGTISATTLGGFDPGVIEHELIGHGIGDLRDEYVDDDYFKIFEEKAERNCYENNNCKPWCKNGECIVGTSCIKGCELSDWYRPHENSFMKISGKEIGKYNEILICKRIKELTNKVSKYCEEII
ncbi:hypothetical protein HYV88_05985 [Candidatus Woesearchaeota archaeon]|nr:hypothetical protein [Candidatus Woesearchaeota archaeon]